MITELGLGAPLGFVKSGSDVASLIKCFEDAMPYLGLFGELWPFTEWAKTTWIGQRHMVMTPEHKGGIGPMMRFRDKLFEDRLQNIRDGKLSNRVDILQA